MSWLDRFSNRLPDVLGVLLISFFILVALAAPYLAPPRNIINHINPSEPYFSKLSYKISLKPQPPAANAPLGTNSRQHDVYYSLVWGTRSALLFSLAVCFSTAALGILVGAVSGYAGGWLGRLSMSVTSGFLTIPVIAAYVIADMVKRIAWARLVGTDYPIGNFYSFAGSSPVGIVLFAIDPLMLALILFSWMPYARILNGLVAALKGSDYVLAARSVGVKDRRIIFRHILPNALPPMLVLLGRDIGSVVLLQAGFTFAGFGGNSIWGSLLWNGMNWILGGPNIFSYWWVWLPATITIMLYGIGWNLFGETLNRRLDPRRFGRA
jgi:peptide/nickel transport system permease protein